MHTTGTNSDKLGIFFLGTGNALINDDENFHSNLHITSGGHRTDSGLYLDCGSDIPHSLRKAGRTHRDMKHVFISHLHGDHAGGLEWLGFATYFDKGATKPTLYVAEEFIGDLISVLRVSMAASANMKEFGIGIYFDIKTYRNCETFSVDGISYTPIRTLHVNDFDELYSYGLLVEDRKKSILFSSDTQFNPNLFMEYYEKADMILHDCSTSPVKYPVHSHISDLACLPEDIKRKMLLYHYGPGMKPGARKMGFRDYALPRVHYFL